MYTLNELFTLTACSTNMLIKCDVEGAELCVFRGATKLIDRLHPKILPSVHPNEMSTYGHMVGQVTDFLHERGYRRDVIAIDHEQHWLIV